MLPPNPPVNYLIFSAPAWTSGVSIQGHEVCESHLAVAACVLVLYSICANTVTLITVGTQLSFYNLIYR